MTKTRILLFLPVLVLLGWTLSMQAMLSSGEKLDLPIRGYDPRDILAGHYLAVQVDFDSFPSECKVEEDKERRYRNDNYGKEAFFCADAGKIVLEKPQEKCKVFIKGECGYNHFRNDTLTRFYISESSAPVLERAIRDGSNKPVMRLSVTKDGRAFPVDLLLDGVPYKEWLKKKTKK